MTFAARAVSMMILVLSTLCAPSYAQWSTDPNVNNAISTVSGNEQYPTIVSDGSGGAIITWQDIRTGTDDIYAQRINASVVIQWTADGVAISTTSGEQQIPTIVSDGSGGAIITWQDFRSGNLDIYAQRVNANGVIQWTADGVAVSTANGNQSTPTIASDGSGGAIITWQDVRSGPPDIYAQRVNANGVVQWTADGVTISTAADNQRAQTIVSDGFGGAIITWADFRSGGFNADIYIQHINASGVVQWTANGVAISTGSGNQNLPNIISDGSDGAIITWQDSRGGNNDIYAQRINASGVIQWTANGVAVSTANGNQSTPTIGSDGSGGAIIVWEDYRLPEGDIYAQRINASGLNQWNAVGVVISTASDTQQLPAIVSDGSSGAIITWQDFRSGNADLYAQRINPSGVVEWTANGTAISTATGAQFTPKLIGDGSSGAIMTWLDGRSGNNDVYTQRVRQDGLLGVFNVPPLLWDNTGISFDAYRASTAFGSLPPDSSIIQGADDFFVPGGKTWTIDSILVNGSFSVAFPTDSLVVAIYANTADKPGALLHRRTLGGISSGGDVRRGLGTPVTLTEGTYWFSVYGVYNTIQNIFWLWQAGTAPSGREAHHQRFIGATYYPWTSFSGVGFSSRSLFFSLYGSENAAPVAYSHANLNKSIPDNDPAGVRDTLTISGIPPGQVVQNIALRIDSLIHTWVGDFRMTLSHNGITRTLMNRPGTGANGSNGDNFIGTVLADSATLRIDNITGDGTPLPGGPPYTGYFRPDSGGTPSIVPSSLVPFIGSDPNGDWVLFMSDNAAQDTGKIQAWSLLLQTGISTSVDPVGNTLPGIFTLEQNYPNPFNPTTTIRFALPVAANVTLKIYNVLGQEVTTLVDGPQNAGTFNAIWNGRSNSGFSVASGVYFYQLVAKASESHEIFQSVQKLVLMK